MTYDSRPREERDFKELYNDLDPQDQLSVFLASDNTPLYRQVSVQLQKPSFTIVSEKSEHLESHKFNRILSEYGYQEIHHPKTHNSGTYIRPFLTDEPIDDVIVREKRQAEYDMDEQDYLYLTDRNSQEKNKLKISEEVFEILITLLENEWMKLEEEMNLVASEEDPMNVTLNLDQGLNNNKYGNDDGVVFGTVDDQKCAVCDDSDCDNSNAIVFCDGCNIAVHQECYGIAFIPEGQWLCRKCMINQHKQFTCCFCPSKTGAFKQLDNSLWSHVVCALWINELYFANPIYMEPIEGIDIIPKSRWKLTCYICKQKVGACIQCSNRNCFLAYHVTCAKRAQLYMRMTKGLQGAIKNKLTLKTYCDKHTPSDYELTSNDIIDGINKTRLYYRDLKLLDYEKDKLTRNKQLNNKLNIFKWKTDNNTPIAPQKFIGTLFNTLIKLKLDSDEDWNQGTSSLLRGLGNKIFDSKERYFKELEVISQDICKYWCLKREYKNGAPLIRKNNNLLNGSSILYGNNSLQEMDNKIEFSEFIMNDLDKVILINEDNLSKQMLEQEMNLVDEQILNKKYFPISQLIGIILNSLLKRDPKKVLLHWKSKSGEQSFRRIMEMNQEFLIKNIKELEEQITKLHHQIKFENKPSNNVVKVYDKVIGQFEMNKQEYFRCEQELNQLNIPIRFDQDYVLMEGIEQTSDLSDVEIDDKQDSELKLFING